MGYLFVLDKSKLLRARIYADMRFTHWGWIFFATIAQRFKELGFMLTYVSGIKIGYMTVSHIKS